MSSSINPETGPAAFAGLSAEKGYELAVKEINEQKFLGENTTLEVTFKDTKGQIPTAASELSTAIADQGVSAVFGSVSSQEAVAQSPLAQNAGLPIIYTQAGSEGVVIGDYTYRATPLMSDLLPGPPGLRGRERLEDRRRDLHAHADARGGRERRPSPTLGLEVRRLA